VTDRAQIDSARDDAAQLNDLLVGLNLAAGEGDGAALDTLLYAIDSQRLALPGIRRVLFDPDDVDEVAQNVLIAVAEGAGRSFRGDGKYTTWLFGVARNKALEFLRRKKDTAEFKTELGETARISSMIANELSIQQLLEGLPEHYRAAVTMRDMQGMAYADIAAALDLNLNTVRAHISRGRAALAAAAQTAGADFARPVSDLNDDHGGGDG